MIWLLGIVIALGLALGALVWWVYRPQPTKEKVDSVTGYGGVSTYRKDKR